MNASSIRLVITSTLVLVFFLPFYAGVALADGCVVSKIAIVAGPWENVGGKISYTVQTQDSVGTGCKVSETLRLSFQSTGAGIFTGETGNPVQAWISSNSANRNFYYQNTMGAAHTLTIQAGYGSADSWSVLWETSHSTADSFSPAATDNAGKEASNTSNAAAKEQSQGQESSTGSAAIAQAGSGAAKSSSSTLAQPRAFLDDPLKLVLSHPKRVSVGQPVLFVATPSGLKSSELLTLQYLWNFGDTGTSSLRTPTHLYRSPGTYTVIGVAKRAGHDIVIRTEITVVPLAITLGRSPDGGLLIQNDTMQEIEISGLLVSDGRHTVTIPDYSYLLPNALIALPVTLTRFSQQWSTASVYDRDRTLLAQYPLLGKNTEAQNGEESGEQITKQTRISPDDDDRKTTAVISGGVLDTNTQSQESALKKDTIVSAITESPHDEQLAAASVREETSPTSSGWKIPVGFVGVLLIGVLALYVHKVV
jgi:PKD repeat protein